MSDPVIVITKPDDVTASAVINALRGNDVRVDVIDPAELLVRGGFEWSLAEHTCASAIWYRRPSAMTDTSVKDVGVASFIENERLAATTALFSDVPEHQWWNHPCKIAAASRKPVLLQAATRLGLRVPRTIITNSEDRARKFVASLGGVAAMKPLANISAEVNGEKRVMFTSLVRETEISDGRFGRVLHFLQEYVEKECEYRVTLVGDESFVARIDSQQVKTAQIDWRRDAYYRSPMRRDEIPGEVLMRLQALRRTLGLNWGAVDMIKSTGGEFFFLEINPNGQWLWVEEATGLPISASFARALSTKV